MLKLKHENTAKLVSCVAFLVCMANLLTAVVSARYISIDSISYSCCVGPPHRTEEQITAVGVEPAGEERALADTTQTSDNNMVLGQSKVFDDNLPLVLALDHSESRGNITAEFRLDRNGENVLEADNIRFSYDRGSTWNQPDTEPQCTFYNAPDDWDGVLFVTFPLVELESGEAVLILFTDEGGGTSSVVAEKALDPPLEPDAGAPWLVENTGLYRTEKTIRLNLPDGFELTKTLEYLSKAEDTILFEPVDRETEDLILHPREDGTEDKIWVEIQDERKRPAAGQYRLRYTLSFKEITVETLTIPLFINYSLV